jgi:hypothetical protein
MPKQGSAESLHPDPSITRRDASWLIARAFAVAGGAQFFAKWLKAAHPEHSAAPPDPHDWASYKPLFFSPKEFQALDIFTSILIPTDETPGAREAYVTPFIDFVVNAAAEYAPQMQTQWRTAVRALVERNFAGLAPTAQVALIQRMSSENNNNFQLIKEMAAHAFYSSRSGLIDVLEYKGLAYLTEFPACTHPEHHRV